MTNGELANERVAVTFALNELWLLHDFIRHEAADTKSWRYPPACEELNDEIASRLTVASRTTWMSTRWSFRAGTC